MMIIRPATAADFHAVCDLSSQVLKLHAERWPQFFKDPTPAVPTRDAYDDWLSNSSRHVLVADVDGEVVGYAIAEVQHRPETPYKYPLDVLYIEQIGVRAVDRRRGCAKALVEAITALPRTRGIGRVELDVWAFNEAAQASFKSMGFEPFQLRMSLRPSEE
jgi:ribosomal protein S18 acetylase RimI-like enzyme